MRLHDRPNGLVLWQGASPLDGRRIVALATGFTTPSQNQATGPMVQVWVLRSNIDPARAVQSGKDRSVCGDCPARPICYVAVQFAPQQVWKEWRSGKYLPLTPERLRWFHNHRVRWGAYGDPALIPREVIQKVNRVADAWTGYTHQWQKDWAQPYQRWFCASVETEEGAQAARALGWRTFRIRAADDPMMPGEFICPKSEEAGQRSTCYHCLACNGARGRHDQRASPVIIHHGGSNVSEAAFRKVQARASRRLSLTVL